MYIVPLILIVAIAIGLLFGPILAVVLFALLLLGLGAYKFLSPGTAPEHAPPPSETQPPAQTPSGTTTRGSAEAEEEHGLWGETWPEQRTGERSS
jgi:hypothetical protein